MTSGGPRADERRTSLSSELFVSLCAAGVWSAIDFLRVGSSAECLVALFGSASLVLGVAVVTLRRAGPFDDALRGVVAGAASASLPLAILASLLERATHHRALGGVTFAFLALGVVLFSIAAARRLLGVARGRGRGASLAMVSVVVAAMGSVAGSAVLLARVGAPSSTPLLAGVVDAAMGVVLLAAAVSFAPRAWSRSSRWAAYAWLGVVAVGIAVAVTRPSLCATLSVRAPVAFVIGAGCGT
jgi:hypothetical protein